MTPPIAVPAKPQAGRLGANGVHPDIDTTGGASAAAAEFTLDARCLVPAVHDRPIENTDARLDAGALCSRNRRGRTKTGGQPRIPTGCSVHARTTNKCRATCACQD